MRLAVIHRPRVAGAPPLSGPVWSTCLREVAFVLDADSVTAEQAIAGEDAYALVLEIVCGLRSPLVGETEVQAQFKAFLASLDPSLHASVLQVGRRVLGDAKAIRHDHLQGLGVGRYAHLALRRGSGSRLAIVGAGALAQDILDHAEPGRPIDVWRRRDIDALRITRAACHRLLLQDADALPRRSESTSLIIAAPVAANVLDRVAACYVQLADVVDLRASDEATVLNRSVPQTTLTDILTWAGAGPLQSVTSARAAIRERARDFGARRQLRPFGWDDLCA
jgi:glutamyl-tRNA reductase